jgi:hypothetical protein
MRNRYGISSFIYRAKRPFHPKRLFNLIHDKFIVIQNIDQVEEEESDDENGENGKDQDEEMDGSDEANADEKSDDDSDIEMKDELASKKFAKEIPPEVSLPKT